MVAKDLSDSARCHIKLLVESWLSGSVICCGVNICCRNLESLNEYVLAHESWVQINLNHGNRFFVKLSLFKLEKKLQKYIWHRWTWLRFQISFFLPQEFFFIGSHVSPLLRFTVFFTTASTSCLTSVILRELVFPTWYCCSYIQTLWMIKIKGSVVVY